VDNLYRIAYTAIGIFLKIFYRLEVNEKNKISSGAIVAGNHVSYLDPLVISRSTNKQVYFIAKSELFKIPLLGWFLKGIGSIPVNRGRVDSSSIRQAIKIVQSGGILAIFPQGTRSDDLNQFGRGVGLIAQKTGAPIYPVRIVGTDKAHVGGLFPFRFPKVKSIVGDPIYPSKIKDRNEQLDISGKVMAAISSLG
jgi:1-acyl-sn-glycerol-3-phosphate acyltransferase